MAKIHWLNAVDADFNTAADWTGGTVPGASDDAILDAGGTTAYTVTASTSETVNSIQTASTATLSITGGTFSAATGTGTGANAGAIIVGDGAIFSVGGSLNNSGVITIDSVGTTNPTVLAIAKSTTLSGGGNVTLTSFPYNQIVGGTSATTLTNVNNTISGAGTIGSATLTLLNQAAGIINASVANGLILNTGTNTITNAGLIEATGSGGLTIDSTVANMGASITAATGSSVTVQNATIIGGTLKTTGTGDFVSIGATFNGATSAVTSQGLVNINDGQTLSLEGSIVNSGTIAIISVGTTNPTNLTIAQSTTLSGVGAVTLSDFIYNHINGGASATTLTNVNNTISGAGTIGSSTLTLVNQAAGVIDGTGANALLINTGSNTVTNAGLIEATGAGGLTIQSATTNTASLKALGSGALTVQNAVVTNTGGVVTVAGSGHASVQTGTINGGTLTIAAGGLLSADSGTSELALGTFTNAGAVSVTDGATLGVAGTIANSGVITVASVGTSNPTLLAIAQNTTLNAKGSVILTDFTFNQIVGGASATTLTNVNNTISGSGTIGSATLTLVNQTAGIIDATGGNTLILNTGANTITNAGLLESTGLGGLAIDSTVANKGGTILAATGDLVNLQGMTVIGGTLNTAGSGIIAVAAGGATFNGTTSAVTNQGAVDIDDGETLGVEGSIINTGTITIDSVGTSNPTVLAITKSTTLSGGGNVTLTDFPYNQIVGGTSATTLTNVNNTISGAGTIGSANLTVVNQVAGIINASVANILILNTGANTIANAGLIEATGSGGLTIDSTVANAGASILAATGSTVSVVNATIIGGALNTSGTGAFFSFGATFDGTASAVTSQGPVNINDGQTLSLEGSIANSGTISIISVGTSNPTNLTIAKSTTLSGAGDVVLSDFIYNHINGGASATTLTNVDNTISGAGTIGSSTLTLVNKAAGIIDATGSSILTLNTGANTISNAGLIEATGAGGLTIQSAATNTANLRALGSGALTIQNAVVTNTGGVVTVASGGHASVQTGTINGGTLTIAAGGLLSADAGTSELALGVFTNAGAVSVTDGATLGVAGTIANSGTITVNSVGTSNPTLLAIAQNTTLNGKGDVVLTNFPYNQIVGGITATTLTNVDNTISGAGTIGSATLTLLNQTAGIIDATGSNALILNTGANTITNAGLIESTGAGGLDIQSTVANAGGSILAATGAVVNLQNVTIIGGTLNTAGTGVIDLLSGGATFDGTTSALTNQGAVNVADGEALNLEGSIVNSGTITVDSVGTTNPTLINIVKNTTLSGKGDVVLTNFPYNQIVGVATATTLTNAGNTISGAGTIGSANLTLVNQAAGVIDATDSTALILNTGTNTITNAGLIESAGAGGLTIDSAITNTGTLQAHTGLLTVVGKLTNVSGTTLTGGTYEADAGQTLELTQNTKIVTTKATIILNGSKSVIEALNTTSAKEVSVDSTLTTIDAGGVLEILGSRNWTTKAAMSNAGTILLGGGTFAAASISNTGTVSGFGTFTAPITSSGVISAQANKTLSLQGGLTNLTGTTLTGGSYVVGAGGTLQLANNLSVVTLDATVDLAGAGANLQSLNTGTSTQVTLDSSLTTIGATGVLEVLGGRNYTTSNAIANSGGLQLGGGTFTSGTLTDGPGATLSGFGTLASVFSESGTVTASGGALGFTGVGDTFTTALGGTEIDFAGGTDLLQSGSSLTSATVGVSGGAVVTLTTSQSYAGKLTLGAGTIALGANTLTLSGTGSTIAGAINGTGALVFGGGTQTVNIGASIGAASWSISAGAVTVDAAVTYGGTFTEAAGTSITIGKVDSLTLTGASNFTGSVGGTGTLALSGGTATFNAGASVSAGAWSLGGGAAVTLKGSLTDSGALTQATGTSLALAANTLTLTGTGSSLGGSVTGGGTLAFTAGTQAINAGANLVVSNWSVSGTAVTSVNRTLSYGGTFTEGSGATVTLTTGDVLSLTGASTLSGTFNGASTVKLSNATVNGLTVGGTDIFSVVGTVDQTGAVTIGDATAKAATLSITTTGTYDIEGDSGIALGNAPGSSIKDSGTLIKSGGTGVSVIAVKTIDSGSMEAASGTLDLTLAITGTGAMSVDSGATLEADSSAAATLSMTFNGGGTLALGNPAKFAATIAGFATGDTIDLLAKAATSAVLGAGDTLVITNGAKAVATLQLTGDYTGDTFTVTSDGNKGSNITVTTGPGPAAPAASHQFIAAMAGLGAGGSGPVFSTADALHVARPMLTGPRPQVA